MQGRASRTDAQADAHIAESQQQQQQTQPHHLSVPQASLPFVSLGVGDGTAVSLRPHRRTATVLRESRASTLRQLDQPVCVLVSDMAGFTKQTRQFGIVHFASKILRMRQVLHPILLQHSPLAILTEADNFLVLFDSARDGLQCATAMLSCLSAYNRLCSDPKNHLELSIGLDSGLVTLETPSGHLFGNAATGAFLLGEDVSDGDILCTFRVKQELERAFPEMLRDNVQLSRVDDDTLPFEHLEKHYFVVQQCPPTIAPDALAAARAKQPERSEDELRAELEQAAQENELAQREKQYAWAWADVNDARFIGEACCLLTQRHQFGLSADALAELDAEITDRFLGARDVAVLLFGLHVGQVTERRGIAQAFTLKHTVLELLEPLIEQHGGRSVEDTFVVFDSPQEAVACALAMTARVRQYNSEVPEEEQLLPKGFGVHLGPMLVAPSTNVHWGDAVSTASKLGEDLAEDYEVLVTDKVWNAIKLFPAFQGPSLRATTRELKTSGVVFNAVHLEGSIDSSVPFPVSTRELTSPVPPESQNTSAATLNAIDGKMESPGLSRDATVQQPGLSRDATVQLGAQTPAAGPSPQPSCSPSLGSVAHRLSRCEPPPLRLVSLRGNHQIGVLDYASTAPVRVGVDGERDAQSRIIIPAVDVEGQAIDDAPVDITTGVMSPGLATRLLKHSNSRTEVGRSRRPTMDEGDDLPPRAPGTLQPSSRRSTHRASGGPLQAALNTPQVRQLAAYSSSGSVNGNGVHASSSAAAAIESNADGTALRKTLAAADAAAAPPNAVPAGQPA